MARDDLGGNRRSGYGDFTKWIFVIGLFLQILMLPAFGEEKGADALPLGNDMPAAVRLESIRFASQENVLDIYLAADGAIKDYKVFALDDPPRIVIDLFGIQDRFKGPRKMPVEDPRARRIRYHAHSDKLRVVVDTEKPYLKQFSAMPVAGGLQIRIGDQSAPAPRESAAASSTAETAAQNKEAPVALSAQQPAAARVSRRTVPERSSSSKSGLPAATRLKSVTTWSWGDYLLVSVMADGEIKNYKSFTMSNPARIVFDFYNLKTPVKGLNKMTVPDKWARSVRYLSYPDKVRLVVDTEDAYLDKFTSVPTEIGLLIKIGNYQEPQQQSLASATAGTPAAAETPATEAAGTAAPAAAEDVAAGPQKQAAAEASGVFADREGTLRFPINGFDVIGNTLLEPAAIHNTVKPHIGPDKTAEDVEKARIELERFYHQQGYVTVLVNIPEQTVESGTVQLEVIESRIRRVRITGNRYFTMEKIQKELPSFREGEILYLPALQEELAVLNRNPDIKVAPVLMPGKELGTIDVELKVKDKLPLHGSLELSNRSSHDTTDLRANALIRYDNLWQKEHSVSFQFQTSPQDTSEVKAFAGSYVLPAPWGKDQLLAFYGLYSDSQVASGQGFETLGKGQIYGVRNIIPLPPIDKYAHNLSLGLDYKDFDDDLSFVTGEPAVATPATYMPLSASYNSSLAHHSGVTMFSGGVNMVFRGLVTDEEEFEDKRFKSRGNYLYATLGVERNQQLLQNMNLYAKLDGQIADQPLISNEQFFAGGLRNVRGYKEVEEAGDNAFHSTVELSYSIAGSQFELGDWWGISPYLFFDHAYLKVKDALPGEDSTNTLMGAGAGVRGYLTPYFDFELAWGRALSDTTETESGENRFYFITKGQF